MKPSKCYDKRTMNRYVDKKTLDTKEVEGYLKNLPDEANNAEWIQADVHDTFLGEDGDGSDRGA